MFETLTPAPPDPILGLSEAFQQDSRPAKINLSIGVYKDAAGRYLGFDFKKLCSGLFQFRGVGRRLDRLGVAGGIEFIDDYGHHPTEVSTTIEAVSRLWPKNRLVVIFQPHRYSRTKLLAAARGTRL